MMLTAVVADSQVVKCNRFSYQQAIHSPRSLQAPERYLTYKQARSESFHLPGLKLSPSRYHSVKADTSITRRKTIPKSVHSYHDRHINNWDAKSVHSVKTDTSITRIPSRYILSRQTHQ